MVMVDVFNVLNSNADLNFSLTNGANYNKYWPPCSRARCRSAHRSILDTMGVTRPAIQKPT